MYCIWREQAISFTRLWETSLSMRSSFRTSEKTMPSSTCNLIWIIFSNSKFTSPTGLECSFCIEDSLRPNGEKNVLSYWWDTTQKEAPSLLPPMCKAQIGLFCSFFAQLYTNAGIYWCTFWICNMVKHMCFGCWDEQRGFGRPSVWTGLLICTNLLYEHRFSHCYMCYILNKLPNSAQQHYSWKHKSHYYSFQWTGILKAAVSKIYSTNTKWCHALSHLAEML